MPMVAIKRLANTKHHDFSNLQVSVKVELAFCTIELIYIYIYNIYIVYIYMIPHLYILYCYTYTVRIWIVCVYRRLGGETNREIDFGFGSVVRARGLVVRWE